MLFASAAPAYALTVSIGGDSSATGHVLQWIFPANSVVVTGGSGNYKYSLATTNDHIFRWSTRGTAQSFSPVANTSQIQTCELSQATYTVTVTDVSTGQKATSNAATYTYNYFNGNPCP